MYIHNKVVFEWDEAKNTVNMRKHNLSFECVMDFDWNQAVLVNRTRSQDQEDRYAAIGTLYHKLHTVIFTKRGLLTRIISLRRAHKPEERAYEETHAIQSR